MDDQISLNDIYRAHKLILPYIYQTPFMYSKYYSQISGAQVYLKLENIQKTGSFKLRGGLTSMLMLSPDQKNKGIITASAGNHAQAIAFASEKLGIPATIYVPKNTPKTKINAIKSYGVSLEVEGNIYDDAENIALQCARASKKLYISPYNDPDVIAGQGTIGLEILKKQPDIDVLLIPLSGGGLFSGISIVAKTINPSIRCYGVQSEACPVMAESLKQGHIVDVPMRDSIAEGLHGGIEKDSITFSYIQNYCEEVLLVSENEIKDAIVELVEFHHLICEGAGAVGLAALKRYKNLFARKKIGIIISGGNLDISDLRSLLTLNP